MKKLILLLMLIPVLVYSQVWENTYGKGVGNWIRQTTDGGYILTGSTPMNGDNRIVLIKLDAEGNSLWAKTFGNTGDNYGYAVEQTTDGGFIIVGETDTSYIVSKPAVYLVKTDQNGDTLWTRTYGESTRSAGYSVQQTTDSGYIITGKILAQLDELYLIKTDSNGDTMWTKTYGGNYSSAGYSVQQTTDGGYIITGHTDYWPGISSNVYLIRTDAQGDTLWTRIYNRSDNDAGFGMQQVENSGFIVVGKTFGNYPYSNPLIWLLRIDDNGDTTWTRTYGDETGITYGFSIQQTTDNGYILTGLAYRNGSSNLDVYLMKTNSSGDSTWTKTYGGSNTDEGFSVQQTTDGGYVISGTRDTNVEKLIYIIKTNSYGNVTFTTEIPLPNPNRRLVKTVDLSGREIKQPRINQPFIEVYDDGTSQKKIKVK